MYRRNTRGGRRNGGLVRLREGRERNGDLRRALYIIIAAAFPLLLAVEEDPSWSAGEVQ